MRNIFILGIILYVNFNAQQDSVKTYNLEEITVKSGIIIEPKTVYELSADEIEKSNANNIYDLAKFIPSLKFQTNSRGESLFNIRGVGKRQTVIFLDGVPLNEPWDNRIDLSLIPSTAIDNFSVVKGIPSVTFGANTPAGVVTLYTKEPTEPFSLLADISGGSENYKNFRLQSGSKFNRFSFLTAFAYNRKDDFRLPSAFRKGSFQVSEKRLNTDYKTLSLYAKAKYSFSENSDVNLSVNYSNSQKGIAPEMNVTEPRFWRYPDWNRFNLSLFGSNNLRGRLNTLITYSFAFTNFNQQIEEYSDENYLDIREIEKDDNNTFYGRALLTSFLNNHSLLKLSINGYTTVHTEKYLSDNYKTFRYSQNLLSTGAEYEYLTANSTFIIGAAYDITSTPETGGKPHGSAQGALGFNSSFLYNFSPSISARINLGRKTRFASLREAYSGALGRFALNPNLKPETVNSVDAGITFTKENSYYELNLFYYTMQDGIVRQTLPEKKFIRINKESIRIIGAEFISRFSLTEKSSVSFNITFTDSKAKNSEGYFSDTLEYKPAVISSLIWDYNPIGSFNIFGEVKFISEEFGLREGDIYFKRLPEYLLFNARFSYTFKMSDNYYAEFYFRINNLFDNLYYPQWGLPEPGREFLGGVKFTFN